MLSHRQAINRRLRFPPASTRMSVGPVFEKISVRPESSRDLANEAFRDDTRPARSNPARDQLNFHCQTEDRPKADNSAKVQDYLAQRPLGSKALSPQSFPLSDYEIVDIRDPDDVFYAWPFDDGYGSDNEQYLDPASPFLQPVDDVLTPKAPSSSRGGRKHAKSPLGTSAEPLTIRDSVQQLLDRGKEADRDTLESYGSSAAPCP